MKDWQQLRQEILQRDNHRCQVCGREGELLVHHLTYDLFQKLIVPKKYLVTLCTLCHSKTRRRSKERKEPKIRQQQWFKLYIDEFLRGWLRFVAPEIRAFYVDLLGVHIAK